jgi:hypothetical protein
MAGSIRNFRYVDDGGNNWAIKQDESNTEDINGAAAGNAPGNFGIPRGLKPRYGLFSSADGTIRRKVVFLTTAAFAAANGTTPTINVDGETLNLTYKRGETVKVYPNVDTGQTDGDNP